MSERVHRIQLTKDEIESVKNINKIISYKVSFQQKRIKQEILWNSKQPSLEHLGYIRELQNAKLKYNKNNELLVRDSTSFDLIKKQLRETRSNPSITNERRKVVDKLQDLVSDLEKKKK